MASNRAPSSPLFNELIVFAAKMLRVAEAQFDLRQPAFDPVTKEGRTMPELEASRAYIKFLSSVIDEKKAFSWSKEARATFKDMCEALNNSKDSTTVKGAVAEQLFYQRAYLLLTQLGGLKLDDNFEKMTKKELRDAIKNISPILSMSDNSSTKIIFKESTSAVESLSQKQAAASAPVVNKVSKEYKTWQLPEEATNKDDVYTAAPRVKTHSTAQIYSSINLKPATEKDNEIDKVEKKENIYVELKISEKQEQYVGLDKDENIVKATPPRKPSHKP